MRKWRGIGRGISLGSNEAVRVEVDGVVAELTQMLGQPPCIGARVTFGNGVLIDHIGAPAQQGLDSGTDTRPVQLAYRSAISIEVRVVIASRRDEQPLRGQ